MSLDIHPQIPHSLRDLAAYSVSRATTPLPNGLEFIARPPSTSSQQSSTYARLSPKPNPHLQLPTLRQLTGLASSSTPTTAANSMQHVSISPAILMNFQATPAATVGPGGQMPICGNCNTNYTPLWRRDDNGLVLCNACGLYLKLHGRPRPVSLKTDVIKSRNRAKPNQQGRKRAASRALNDAARSSQTSPITQRQSEAAVLAAEAARQVSAAHHDLAAAAAAAASASPSTTSAQDHHHHHQHHHHHHTPLPSLLPPPLHHPHQSYTYGQPQLSIPHPSSLDSSNIAPQSMFDGVTSLDHASFYASPSLSTNPFRALSPSHLSASGPLFNSGNNSVNLQLPTDTKALQTRVSELQVISSRFKDRVEELELLQDEQRRADELAEEERHRLQADFDATLAKLKQRVALLEAENQELKAASAPVKRARLSEPARNTNCKADT